MIIDFHTHTFPSRISKLVVDKLSAESGVLPHTDGSADGLSRSTALAHIDFSVNLPVVTNPAKSFKINEDAVIHKEELHSMGIIPFGGIHPDCEDYRQQLKYLADNNILGIKIHPAYQNVDFNDIRYMRIIEYASSLGLIILTHAGIDIGLYTHNYCDIRSILKVLNEINPDRLILAHMGNWGCWDDVLRYLAGCDAYFDTAFSIGPIDHSTQKAATPYYDTTLDTGLFAEIVQKHGSDKILFGSDSPWQDQKTYLERIKNALSFPDDFSKISGGNAKKLLKL